MSTDSNMGSFNSHNMMPPPPPSSPIYNRLAINFQSGAVNSMSPMNPLMNPGGMGGMTVGMYVHGNSGVMSSTSTMSPSPGGMSSTSAMNLPGSGGPFIDQMPAIKHDTGLSVDWSADEQAILEDGLIKFSDEPNIMRYIKIAATLRDKTVRDVALRCRWMTKKENGKRRKPEECYTGKKMKDRKDNLVDPALNPNISLPPQTNVGVYPAMMQHRDQISCAATMADDQAGFLLKENIQAFHQISFNLHNLKLQENVELFCRTRNNISTLLNGLRDMQGMMMRMPPLPVSIDEELASTILPGTSQAPMYGSSSGLQMKPEPRC